MRLDGLLGNAKLVHRMPRTNSQVWDDILELPTERGEGGDRLVDALCQGAERARVSWGEPKHLIAEPVGAGQLKAEPPDGGE